MNKEKYARLTIVLDLPTDRALRRIAEVTDQGLSTVVRELISDPAQILAATLDSVVSDPESKQAALDQLEMFVEGQYGDYLRERGERHG